ncbi:probable WRKY transcription factor 29 [Abrus precatorius]|uniref:Probable WRKY transcription factor 29 n=1 Tax=Abrus precatorius TaxID=3816 RepID=A0A8B8M5Z9_ABRPR|nr:probable WRKY transcription factor 29 [Abrus precatorius]
MPPFDLYTQSTRLNAVEFSETTTVVDELEEFYKPLHPPHPILNNPLPIVTNSLPIPHETEQEVKELKPSKEVATQDLRDPPPSKCEKSKKKQKNKRVKHVLTAADGVSDQWAWRKYGQKPIKGSTYPRSYYRCSSSKGCLARKQVERSHLDPGVFIVTYTAEHSDPHPPRKSSRARNTRKNTSTVAPPITHDQDTFSPRTPETAESIEDEHAPSVERERSKGLKKEKDFVGDS